MHQLNRHVRGFHYKQRPCVHSALIQGQNVRERVLPFTEILEAKNNASIKLIAAELGAPPRSQT
jgi:hypothetical protein